MARAHDDTSAALVTAAHRLLANEGPDALTVRRIANEAGMSTMNVYSRFGGKDGVIDELHHDGFERLVAAIDQVPHTESAVADLIAMATAYREFAVAHPRYYEIMFGAWPATNPRRRTPDGLGRYLRRVEQSVDEIALPHELEPRSAAVWMWATCHGMVSLELNGLADESVDWSHVYDSGVHAAVEGLARHAGLTTPHA